VTRVPLTVVKCGGAARVHGQFVLERHVEPGSRAVVVHGAGGRISAAMEAAGFESRFVGGRRVTGAAALPVIRKAFEQENIALCRDVGLRARGLMGDELGLEAEPIPELGQAGMLLPVVPDALRQVLENDEVPVIASLARGPLNVNADDAAAVLAIALGADRLTFVTDVPGVMVGRTILTELSERDIPSLELSGGIVPKLEAAVLAAREGVHVELGVTVVTP
jgi:acetylglutamate kinase